MPPDPSWAIVVNVGCAENSCLSAIPFAAEFKRISEAIQKAVARIANTSPIPIRYERLDESPTGQRISMSVIEKIRAARVVVSVCSPQSKVSVPNPNVMYELGLAMALDKPILILTTDPSMVADIRDITALVYKRNDDFNSLAGRIEAELRSIFARLKNPVTRGSDRDVWPVQARHRMLLNPEFWECFSVLFEYANSLRLEMEFLYGDHSYDFRHHGKAIALGKASVSTFKEVWSRYLARYENAQGLIAGAGIVNALDHLKQIGSTDGDKDQVNAISNYIDLVEGGIEQLRSAHQKTAEICGKFSENDCPAGVRTAINQDLLALMDAVKALVDYSTGLVLALLDPVTTGFGERPRPPESAQARSFIAGGH